MVTPATGGQKEARMGLNFMALVDAVRNSASGGATSSKDALAKALAWSPEAMKAFEKAYAERAVVMDPSDPFGTDAKTAAALARSADADVQTKGAPYDAEALERVKDRIVAELLLCSEKGVPILTADDAGPLAPLVTNDDLRAFPACVRPRLTGSLYAVDLGGPPSCYALYDAYSRWKAEKDPARKAGWYHRFRQGLDVLDLDTVTYEALGRNPNSIGHWLPALKSAVEEQGFFRIPKTTIRKVPLPILQLSRIGYETLNRSTLEIVDRWAYEAFGLDETKDYFVKTGTYSSKFNFRNCAVRGAKEVRELGEYLLFMQSQACEMAGPLSSPSIYGVSTTNEWCVRELVEDVEGAPTIYEGLPLHAEFRAFVDFDSDRLLGISPYWRSDVMKKRFSEGSDSDDPRRIHDYVVFSAYEETLAKRHDALVGKVSEAIRDLVPLVDLRGQWSLDVMANGDDLWAIDMALAANSALRDCVPAGELAPPPEERWFPEPNEKLEERRRA